MSIFSRFINNKNRYLTQDELLDKIVETCPNLSRLDNDIKRNVLYEIINNINEACTMYGGTIENIKLIRLGQDACVFECNEKIIKLTRLFYGIPSLSSYMSNCDAIIQPLYERTIIPTGNPKDMCITIHLFDKLDTKGISMKDSIDMYIKLREDGYIWSDPRPENIGRDPEGNLKLIDYGQVIYINDKDDYFKYSEIKVNEKNYPIYAEAYNAYISHKEQHKL